MPMRVPNLGHPERISNELRPFDMYSVKPGEDVNPNRSIHNIRTYTSGVGEEVQILVSKLVFTFPRELWTSLGIPSKFDDRYTDLLELFDLAVYDFYRFFNKVKLIVNPDHFQSAIAIAIYMADVPYEEDYQFLAEILALLVPLAVLAIGVDLL
ncbi:hypothetical protein Tco_0978622 [Tanacetum coccineum]|uniref:Uncharacterized protein n=1 Tax=Tanacetum coccineum TaxID=301880 RepID=A0ABQ5ENJ9_9ASTR